MINREMLLDLTRVKAEFEKVKKNLDVTLDYTSSRG